MELQCNQICGGYRSWRLVSAFIKAGHIDSELAETCAKIWHSWERLIRQGVTGS